LDNALSDDQLLQCAKMCGSDTAFCLKGGTQWGEGTGTDLSDLPPSPEMHLLLVNPSTGVNTADAYQVFDKVGNYATLDKKLWVELLRGKDLKRIGENLTNSLETAAFQLLPEIRWIKEHLFVGVVGCANVRKRLDVFGILEDERQGKQLAAQFANLGIFQTWLGKNNRKGVRDNGAKISTVKLDSYKPLREIVLEALREAIVSGILEPGERLMEIQLAEEMGVSRTPSSVKQFANWS
jgi:hypothetical protein